MRNTNKKLCQLKNLKIIQFSIKKDEKFKLFIKCFLSI